MFGELLHLQLDVVDCAIDLWPPVLESQRQFLDFHQAFNLLALEVGEALLPLDLGFEKPLVETTVLIGEELLNLIKGELRIGIHSTKFLLESGKVIVGRKRIQDWCL